MTVLIVNTILLVFATAFFSFHLVSGMDIRSMLFDRFDRLNSEYNERRIIREIKRYERSVPFKMNMVEKVELFLIDKSNIRHYIPFMNFYTLILLCLLIFAAVFGPIYRALLFFPSTLIISMIFSLLPIFILDLMCRHNSEKIRRKLAEFISVLNRWCAVKEDIFFAFEKSIDSNIGMPLKTFIRDMVIQVEHGIEPLDALEILMMKVDNAQFKDFIINIKQSVRYRGDIRRLLTNLENQFYKIEEEFNRRKISTYKDRMLIYIVMFAVLFTGYWFLKLNPHVEEFYMCTFEGKTLLVFFCILYASGFWLSLRISSFKY